MNSREAEDACAYERAKDSWSCIPERLSRVTVTEMEWAEPAGLRVRIADPETVDAFFGNEPSDGCFSYILFAVSHPTADVVIDWDSAAFVLNGNAVDAVPGFARVANVDLRRRGSTVPAKAWFRETVHPMQGDCLASRELPYASDHDVVRFQVPVRVGEETVKISWTRTRRRGVATEADALAVIDAEDLPDVQPRNVDAGFSAWTTLGAAGGGVAVGGVCGGLLGLPQGSLAFGNPLEGAAIGAGIGAGICGTLFAGGGLIADVVDYNGRTKELRDEDADRARVAESRKRDKALARRKHELGIDEAQAGSKSAAQAQ